MSFHEGSAWQERQESLKKESTKSTHIGMDPVDIIADAVKKKTPEKTLNECASELNSAVLETEDVLYRRIRQASYDKNVEEIKLLLEKINDLEEVRSIIQEWQ